MSVYLGYDEYYEVGAIASLTLSLLFDNRET